MKRVRIDGQATLSMAEVHAAFARALGFPAWYGANLDALYDMLTREVAGPVEVTIVHAAALRQRLGPSFAGLERLLSDVAAERADIAVAWRD